MSNELITVLAISGGLLFLIGIGAIGKWSNRYLARHPTANGQPAKVSARS